MRTRLKRSACGRPLRPAALSGLKVSVVVPVMNERRTLPYVLREVRRLTLPPPEIIVVANGSTDGSDELAHALGVNVIRFAEPLGHDVGRSVGARHATGDIILFVDGDMRIAASQLRPFIAAVAKGTDVALNRYLGPVRSKYPHPVVVAKHALNAALGRADLRGASLTTVPHALSRRALNAIGADSLCVPPKALAMAVIFGLRVQAVHLVNVAPLNPVRRARTQGGDPLAALIVGDHLEAMQWLTEQTDERGRHADLTRKRNMVR